MKSRQNEADLLAYLAEVDKRQLYLERACSSMHRYCTEVLHFSEGMAYHRIAVARAARRHPLLLERIREGTLHLSGAYLLASRLTPENHVELLDRAHHKTKRAIEELLADLAPKPNVPARIRQLPDPRPVSRLKARQEIAQSDASPSEAPPAEAVRRAPSPAPQPLGGKRFKIQFTGDGALCEKLREAKSLLRHRIPDGDLAEIFDRALTVLLEVTKRERFAQTSRPRKQSKAAQEPKGASRHIPAEIKRAVFARDRGRCAFVARNGRRCESRDFLEYHHRDPWGKAKRHSTDRIELRCRGHNRYAAMQDYGPAHMARFARRDNCTRVQLEVERQE